ncbi:MAG: hypothetical protein ACLPKE_22755 [Streptosporangiaceae bacterium]
MEGWPVSLRRQETSAVRGYGQSGAETARCTRRQAKGPQFHALDLVLGIEIGASPVIARPGGRQECRPGVLLPHRRLPGGRSLYDELGTGLTLLVLAAGADPAPWRQAAGSRGVPLIVLDLTSRAWPGPALVLVRPDQYDVWTGDAAPGDPSALLDLVRGAGGGSLRREPPRDDQARAR